MQHIQLSDLCLLRSYRLLPGMCSRFVVSSTGWSPQILGRTSGFQRQGSVLKPGYHQFTVGRENKGRQPMRNCPNHCFSVQKDYNYIRLIIQQSHLCPLKFP